MADNVAVTPGSGTNIATDERTIAATTVQIQRVLEIGASTGSSGQTTVTNSSTTIKAAVDTRLYITLLNLQTVAVFVDPGGGTATTSNFRLDPGASMTIWTTGAVTAITSASYAASGDTKVHRTESKIRVPEVGEPYWQTVCGLRFAGEIEEIRTAHDRKQVTCAKCKAGR